MSEPGPAVGAQSKTRTGSRSRFLAYPIAVLLLAVAGWFLWVGSQIRYYAEHDGAEPADAIAVFGAAEYAGRPSPVLRARLDHGLTLYRRGLAPLMITLGGQGDAYHSEGSVGRDYLVAQGVPESRIIAETQSNNTMASIEQLAVIASRNQIASVVAVSDGTHLFRIRAMCERKGLRVFTSPRAAGKAIPWSSRAERMAHEMFSYTLWRIEP